MVYFQKIFNIFNQGDKRQGFFLLYLLLYIIVCLLFLNITIYYSIKLENIFLHNGSIKVGDFGFAREIPVGPKALAQTWCGSLFTMAPEVIEGAGHGIKVDVYSIGVIFY